MNTKEWADKLNGRQYRHEFISQDEDAKAKSDGVVIVFGASDDLVEFRGAVNDETGAWEGTTVQITPNFKIFNEEDNRDTFEFNAVEIAKMQKITAVWCPKGKDGEIWASWSYNTDIPHETFDIIKDDELYCRGIVFEALQLGAL